MKIIFIFFFSFLYITCIAQDTVYVDYEPIVVEKKVYYVKPKDTINIKKEIRLLSSLGFAQSILYNDSEYNDVEIKKTNQLVEELELSVFKKKKKIQFGLGVGVSQNNFSFNQNAFSTTSIDSTRIITIDIITDSIQSFSIDSIFFDSVFFDTTFFYTITNDTITTETWETRETEEEHSSQSTIRSRYAFIPVYLGTHLDKGKFSFSIFLFLKSYFLISQTGDINLIPKGESQSIIIKDWINKMFWQYGTDFSVSYNITKNINLIANARFNALKHSSINLKTDRKYMKLNFGLGTSFVF